MGNDNCGCLKAWPNDKTPMNDVNGWAFLPTILLHDIFTRLSPADRRKASTVCRNWRQALYHPRLDFTFKCL